MSVKSLTVKMLGVGLLIGCTAPPRVETATPAVTSSPTAVPDNVCLYEGRPYTEGARFTRGDDTYRCERDDQGKLHWTVRPSVMVF